MSKFTTVEYMKGQDVDHVCLRGEIAPSADLSSAIVSFIGEDETFFVPINRLVSVDVFEVEENVAEFPTPSLVPNVN